MGSVLILTKEEEERNLKYHEIFQAVFEEWMKDQHGDGSLTPADLVKLEACRNLSLTQAEAEEIINMYDTTGDGKMNIDEFVFYRSNFEFSGDYRDSVGILV